MVTEMGDEGAVPTVSISEHGDGVAWLLKSAVLLSPSRKSPFMSTGLPELDALDKIVSIPKLDPLDPSMLRKEGWSLHNNRLRLLLLPARIRERKTKESKSSKNNSNNKKKEKKINSELEPNQNNNKKEQKLKLKKRRELENKTQERNTKIHADGPKMLHSVTMRGAKCGSA